MNISNTVTSSATSAFGAPPSSAMRQQMQDFRALGKALQQGDLGSAQSAFDQWSKDLQNATGTNGKPSPLQDSNSAASKDLKALQDALKNGDLKSAQDAFKSLKNDLRPAGAGGAHHAHHGHHAQGAGATGGDGDGDGDDQGPPAIPGQSAGSSPLQSLNVTA